MIVDDNDVQVCIMSVHEQLLIIIINIIISIRHPQQQQQQQQESLMDRCHYDWITADYPPRS